MINKKTGLLLIIGTTLVVSVAIVLSILLSSNTQTASTAPKKTKAAGVTYTKYVAINRITPTMPVAPTAIESSSTLENEVNVLSGENDVTPTPDDINLVVTPVITNTYTVTTAPTITPISTTTIAPTKTQKLLESGNLGFSFGLLIIALAFISVAFLL